MTAPAARASLAAALQEELGDHAATSVDRLLKRLNRDGWDLAPATGHPPSRAQELDPNPTRTVSTRHSPA